MAIGAAWVVCLCTLCSVAYAQSATPDLVMPAGPGTVALSISDLTFPGAVLVGFWMFARSLPGALQSWRPTLRVELVDKNHSKEADNG